MHKLVLTLDTGARFAVMFGKLQVLNSWLFGVGSSLASRTRIKTLAHDTILANARFFNNDITAVPRMALTVGLATILDAREVVVIVTGQRKALALSKAIGRFFAMVVLQCCLVLTFAQRKAWTIWWAAVPYTGSACYSELLSLPISGHSPPFSSTHGPWSLLTKMLQPVSFQRLWNA